MAEGALVVLFLLFGIAFAIGLYLLIESETSNPTVVDRRTAEREAKERGGLRRRGDNGPERDEGSDRATTGWEERPSPSDEDDPEFGWDDR
ncbi:MULTISPECIES: hypothetical protein [Natrialbaceae]|uniref:hypothetical protein n=1 Tax=Natrialbaceae TaxID=1644061 RepID=UPI00207C262D|nr:hypothetical protein [Natronococcus sp. CG52]